MGDDLCAVHECVQYVVLGASWAELKRMSAFELRKYVTTIETSKTAIPTPNVSICETRERQKLA